MTLRPCQQCRRHINVDDASCPFCASPSRAPAPATASIYGRFSRAAVFAGVAGCYVNPPPQQQPPPPPPPYEQGQQPPPPPPDNHFARPPEATGVIRGVLTDSNGAPIPNIQVNAVPSAGGRTVST